MRPGISRAGYIAFVVALAAAPLVYSRGMPLWRLISINWVSDLNLESMLLHNALVVLNEVAGNAVVAVLLVAPLTVLIRGRPLLLAACLAISVFVFTFLPNLLFDALASNFAVSRGMLWSHLFFFFLAWAAGYVVNRFFAPVVSADTSAV